MIAHLRGRVAVRAADHVVVDVNGVGYLVHIPATVAASVPPRGEQVELHTSLQVREDSMTLYGFTDPSGRTLFELLLTASGVGPKVALTALSTLAPSVLTDAIVAGDIDTLVAIPGVGKKSAQRLVLELRDKLGATAGGDLPGEFAGGPGTAATPLAEVREALLALGYTAGESQQAMVGLDPTGDTSALLREALRSVGAGAKR